MYPNNSAEVVPGHPSARIRDDIALPSPLPF
jgi:hypothetical protein